MNLKEAYEQLLYCAGFEDICRNCPYHMDGSCDDIFDLMHTVANAIEEALNNGMENN